MFTFFLKAPRIQKNGAAGPYKAAIGLENLKKQNISYLANVLQVHKVF
jgi:hypothetical protein